LVRDRFEWWVRVRGPDGQPVWIKAADLRRVVLAVYGGPVAEGESEAQRRQREADPFVIGLTQHALENADTEQLADLIEAFLTSDDQVMRDAGAAPRQQEMGLIRENS
jgi:hypothetical protein